MKNYQLIIIGAVLAIAGASPNAAQTQGGDFAAFLVKADSAQVKLQNGSVSEYKALWSNRDDVTISGGLGGTIDKGWDNVSKRLDWAGTQFSQGKNTIERLVAYSEGNIGYVVQLEHIKFKVPATGNDATRNFRVTMIFRRERGKWKFVHRHADGSMTKQPAQ